MQMQLEYKSMLWIECHQISNALTIDSKMANINKHVVRVNTVVHM